MLRAALPHSTSTAFVVYGDPPAIPLQVLRLDGAGTTVCTYSEAKTGKFEAEVAFYNTASLPQRFAFAFGLSPFLPYVSLAVSSPLQWTGRWGGTTTQPGELWVKVVEVGSGTVRVASQRVPLNAQKRNLVGLSLASDGVGVQLDLLQAGEGNGTSPAVSPNHFRLLFAHAALTLPPATIYANDDLELMGVPAGGHGHLDHPLLPPHQAGRILKISFKMGGQAAVSSLIDLSTLCEGAAYALVLVGTLDRLDAYDPVLVQVDGTPTACSLPSAAVSSGESASLAFVSMASHPQASARVEFGSTLLSLNRRSVPLQFAASTVTDVLTGDCFMRLVKPDPPFAPLTPVLLVKVHPQSRNVVVARASGHGAELGWQLTDLGSQGDPISADSTRVLLLNMLDDSAGGGGSPVSVDVSGSISQTITLLPQETAAFEYPSDGGALVKFTDVATGTAVGEAISIPFGDACPQSVQLVAAGGVLGSQIRTVHVDAADGYCRLVVPSIPSREALEGTTTQPPATTSTLDIFGPDGPGDGGLIQDSAASAASGGLGHGGLRTMSLSLAVVAAAALAVV